MVSMTRTNCLTSFRPLTKVQQNFLHPQSNALSCKNFRHSGFYGTRNFYPKISETAKVNDVNIFTDS